MPGESAKATVTDVGVLVNSTLSKASGGLRFDAPPWTLLHAPEDAQLGEAVLQALAMSNLDLSHAPDYEALRADKRSSLGWGNNGPRELCLVTIGRSPAG